MAACRPIKACFFRFITVLIRGFGCNLSCNQCIHLGTAESLKFEVWTEYREWFAEARFLAESNHLVAGGAATAPSCGFGAAPPCAPRRRAGNLKFAYDRRPGWREFAAAGLGTRLLHGLPDSSSQRRSAFTEQSGIASCFHCTVAAASFRHDCCICPTISLVWACPSSSVTPSHKFC